MAGIQGIGGFPLPPNTSLNGVRGNGAERPVSPARDGVAISGEAQLASHLAQLVERTQQSQEMREERVEQARANLEQGLYKMNEMVRVVASRISAYIG